MAHRSTFFCPGKFRLCTRLGLGFGAEMSDVEDFHDLLTELSARKVELTKGDAEAFRALVEAVARTAQEVSAAYDESPDIARKRYGYFAARSALAAGAVRVRPTGLSHAPARKRYQ